MLSKSKAVDERVAGHTQLATDEAQHGKSGDRLAGGQLTNRMTNRALELRINLDRSGWLRLFKGALLAIARLIGREVCVEYD